MVEWRITRNQTTIDSDLYDVEVTDTANPFGSKAVAFLDDTGGTKFGKYTRGTRVDFAYSTDGGTTWTTRFSGYVVEARELNEQGADALEVECYSFDQFLRRETVTNDQTGNTIKQALNDIVLTDTPVEWVEANVNIENNLTLSRSYRGEKVENVLQSLRSKSANEDFGVNQDLEFFFRPRETERTARGVDNSQWLNYDIPEQGKRTVNEVTVFYNDGNESVTIDNGSDKLQLQDSLGTRAPVSLGTEVSRPEITALSDARDVGNRILDGKSKTLSGTVTTFGLYDAEPGDVCPITIVDRGIDTDFRIAELQYIWGTDETVLTVVEKRGNQDQLLVNLSDTLKRVETAGANRDGTNNRVTSTNVTVELDVTGEADGSVVFDDAKITNWTRNTLRRGWAGETAIDITDMAVGDGSADLSRANTALGNELERDAVTQSTPNAVSAEFSGTFSSATGVTEIGLFDSAGNLVARGILNSPVDASFAASMTLTVSDSLENERGVMTLNGQETVRNILIDQTPSPPVEYVYGTDGALPSTGDTALGAQEFAVELDEESVQIADTQTDWEGITSFSDSDRVSIDNGQFGIAQSLYLWEGESASISGTNVSDAAYSGGSAANINTNISSTGDTATFNFTPEHTISASDVAVNIRLDAYDGSGDGTCEPPEIAIRLNGETLFNAQYTTTNLGLQWDDMSTDGEYTGGDLQRGTQYALEIEVTDGTVGNSSDALRLDVLTVYDNSQSFTFPDTVTSDGYLPGPSLYGSSVVATVSEVTSEKKFSGARVASTWTSVAETQQISVSPDGGSTWLSADNTGSLEKYFDSDTSSLQVRFTFASFGSGRTFATPTEDYAAIRVSSYELFGKLLTVSPSDIGKVTTSAIVDAGVATGLTLREGGQRNESGTLLTHTVFAEFTVDSNQQIVTSETVEFVNAG